MNDKDGFDMSELRELQLDAIKAEYQRQMLDARILYEDRMRRIDYLGIKCVTRNSNLVAEFNMGIHPIQCMEN